MKLQIKVNPNSKLEKIEKLSEDSYLVAFKCPPIEGRANKKLIELLSKHFKVPKSKIEVIRGHKNKNKVVVISTH